MPSYSAVLIAAAADGHNLQSFQQSFCRVSSESEIYPDPALSPIYQNALERFENLLARELDR